MLTPVYSSPRRLSAACPPTGRGSGPAQDQLTWVALSTPRRATTVRPPVGATAPICRPGSTSSIPTNRQPCSGQTGGVGSVRVRGSLVRPRHRPPAGLVPQPASPQAAALFRQAGELWLGRAGPACFELSQPAGWLLVSSADSDFLRVKRVGPPASEWGLMLSDRYLKRSEALSGVSLLRTRVLIFL